MKLFNLFIIVLVYLIISVSAYAQSKDLSTKEHSKAIKKVFIETYYTITDKDIKDTIGGVLPQNSKTYRIYIQLHKNYTLQAIYGSHKQPLEIKTSTTFYNNTNSGTSFGFQNNDSLFKYGNMLLDSWLTIGAISKNYIGIPKKNDIDGSILASKKFKKRDGIHEYKANNCIVYGLDMNFFRNQSSENIFSSENGLWATPLGYNEKQTNSILIAQLTTDGKISFLLNIQIADKEGNIIKFVAQNPSNGDIKSKKLIYNY